MAAPIVQLTFTDGRTEEVRLNPRVLIEAERKYGDMSKHAIESALYGAWWRLGRPDKDFDTWLDTVENADQVEGDAVPTAPEASVGS